MDFVIGGFCTAHQEKLDALCKAATDSGQVAPAHATPLGPNGRMLNC